MPNAYEGGRSYRKPASAYLGGKKEKKSSFPKAGKVDSHGMRKMRKGEK